MRRVASLPTCILLVAFILLGCMELSAQYRRADINSFSPAEQLQLRQLMMQWITTSNPTAMAQHLAVIGALPVGVHCNTGTFLTWHRTFIDKLETWLMTQPNGSKYVPLPKWNPVDSIPNAFFNTAAGSGSAVATGYAALVRKNPSVAVPAPPPSWVAYNFSRFLTVGTLCNYTAGFQNRVCMGVPGSQNTNGTAFDNFARDLEGEHNRVHINTAGVMNSGSSPAAAFFFLWHAYIDDIYRHYECACTSGVVKAKDLYIKDNNADVGAEPNTTTGVFYSSPEIWVRKTQDVIVAGRYSLEDDPARHEDAEYSLTDSHYVYVRIRNNGCQATVAADVDLHLYWSKANTGGLTWSTAWINNLPNGDEITTIPVDVPALNPGQTWVAEIPWFVPNPDNFPGNPEPNHFCLLARLVSAADPMAVTEIGNVNYNTEQNNNVAWKNIAIYNSDPFNIIGWEDAPFNHFYLQPTLDNLDRLTLRFDAVATFPITATIELDPLLHDLWQAEGSPGTGIRQLEGRRIEIIEPNATITWPSLDPATQYLFGVQAYVRCTEDGGTPCAMYGDIGHLYITQVETSEDGEETVVGGEDVEIRIKQSEATKCGDLIGDVVITKPTCPSANDGSIKLSLTRDGEFHYFWSNGGSSDEIGGVAPGTYTVIVRNEDNCVDTRTIVVESASTLSIETNGTNPTCSGANGEAWVKVTGGGAPYKYQWYKGADIIDGATKDKATRLSAGTYTVEVTDAKNCAVRGDITIDDHMGGMVLAVEWTNASSPDATDGSAEVFVESGMEPFTYEWSNGASEARVEGLGPGIYTVEVSDHMGCSNSATVEITYENGLVQSVDRTEMVRNVNIVPNPATSSTELSFQMGFSANVRIDIYDMLGKLVRTVDEQYRAAGPHSVTIDTRGLPGGRYSCRIGYSGGIRAVPFVIVH